VSNVERGVASLTAEQLLLLMRIFNVDAGVFDVDTRDAATQIQNALARFGAQHLHESELVLPTRKLAELSTVIIEALATREPRLMTALAPVIVLHIDSLNLKKLRNDARALGLEQRLAWLVENTLEAIRLEQATRPPRAWASRYRRAEVLLEQFLSAIFFAQKPAAADVQDVLDSEIRSKKTIAEVTRDASSISRLWGVITRLQPDDFAAALRGARVDI